MDAHWLTYSGYICISLPEDRLQELDIPMMVAENQDPHRTAYTVTVDYRHGALRLVSYLVPVTLKNRRRYHDRDLCA